MLHLLERLLAGWTHLAHRAGWVFLVLFAAAAVAAGWYAAGNLKVNTDTSAMIDPSLPFQKRAHELREAFPEVKNDIAVILRAPTLDEADAFAVELRRRALAKPDIFSGVFAPSAEPFFRDNGLLYLDTDELEARLSQMSRAAGLIETLVKAPTAGQLFSTLAENDRFAERSELGRETLSRIYGELADVVAASAKGETRPFSWMGALDPGPAPATGHVRIVYVSPKLDFTRLQPAKAALAELEAEIAGIEPSFEGRVETFITGDPALRADELSAVMTGMELSVVISMVLIGALLILCFRSIAMSAVTLAALVISILFAGAYAAYAVGELNLVSVAFIVLIGGLGHEFAIHLLLLVQERRQAGESVAEALSETVKEVGPALVLAAAMTSLGFFSFVPTAFVGIAQLGIIAGVGILIALVVTLTFVPAALGVFGVDGRKFRSGRANGGGAPLTTGLALTVLALGALSLFLLPQSRFDADPMALRDPGAPSVRGFNLLFDDRDTIPYRLTAITDSEAEAVSVAEKARAIPTVGGVRTLEDFVPEDQEDKLDLIDYASGSLAFALDAPENRDGAPSAADGARKLIDRLSTHDEGTAGRRLAAALQTIDGVAAMQRVEANIFAYWPALVERLKVQFNAGFIDIASLPDNLKRRYLSADGKWRVDLLPKADVRDPENREAFVRSVEEVFPAISGGAIQTEKAGDVVSNAMLKATALALAGIALVLLILLRNVKDVALILFPLGLAAVLTVAAGALFDIPFNYANIIVLPLLLGTGVDAGIHLVMRWRQQRADEGAFGAATPRAVFYSALSTIAAFGSLTLSSHRGIASMGQLLTLAIGFTLVCTLIVLPVVFRWIEREKRG